MHGHTLIIYHIRIKIIENGALLCQLAVICMQVQSQLTAVRYINLGVVAGLAAKACIAMYARRPKLCNEGN